MFCDRCGTRVSDDAKFCPNCGKQLRAGSDKNIYIALILTFFITGLGSIYAGNVKKGLILLIIRIATALLTLLAGIFFIVSMLIWAYGFYEAYRDVQIANGHQNPKLIKDFKTWNQNTRTIAVLIICIIVIFMLIGFSGYLTVDKYSHTDTSTHYYTSGSGSTGSGGSSSHYGGVDTSPSTIARNDPDWYYDHYEYGDNPDIDDYLESEGYD